MRPVGTLALCLALGTAVVPVRRARAEVLERVVAVIEDDAIFLSDLERRLRPFLRELDAIENPRERAQRREQLYRETLDQMVDQALIRRAAQRAHLTATDEDVDRMVAGIADQRHVSADDIYTAVTQTGMTREEYRDFLRADILRLRVLNVRVRNRVNITDNDIAEEYRRRVRLASSRAPFEAAHIFLAFPPAPTAAQVAETQRRAEAVVAQLQGGADFAELAHTASDDPATRDNGGQLGRIDPGAPDAAPPDWLLNALRDRQPGQMTGAVRGENGYHVFRLISRETPNLPTLSAAHDALSGELLNREMARQQAQYLRELRSRSSVDVRL